MQGEDDAQQLLCDMGQSYTVRLALSPLFCIVLRKYWFVSNKRQTGVHKGVAKVRRTVFYHVTLVFSQTRLVVTGLQTSERKQLSWVFKFVNVTILRKNNRSS